METRFWDEEGDLGGRFAPNLAKWIIWVVFCALFALGTLNVLWTPLPLLQGALSISIMFILLTIQLLHVSRHGWRLRQSWLGYTVLCSQILLVFPPMLIFDEQWVGVPSFLAGSALLILRPLLGWITFGLVILSVGALEVAVTAPGKSQVLTFSYAVVSALITGLVVYGLTKLATLVTAIDAARTEMAKMAVAAERLRFSRDLHDLLGYSLSAISLKSELTHRLVTKNPARAEEELTQIIEISRQALTDVRSVASGYRELSLDEEAISARSVLSAADVEVHMSIEHQELPAQVRTVLATVLREGVTNVLRHSKAERCDIILRQSPAEVTIEICNDGVPGGPQQRMLDGGSGIQNLSNRVAHLDGTLTTTADGDGHFRLRAAIPTVTR